MWRSRYVLLTLPACRAADCSDKFTNGALVTPQNCNFTGCGAYTGEMSVEQMKDLGIKQVRLPSLGTLFPPLPNRCQLRVKDLRGARDLPACPFSTQPAPSSRQCQPSFLALTPAAAGV